MAMHGFDTHDAYEHLVEDDSFNAEQAGKLVKVVSLAVTGEVATKTDIATLTSEISEVKSELKTEIAELRTEISETRSELKTEIAELRTEISETRSELKTEISEVRSELKTDIETVRTDLAKQHSRMIAWVVGAIAAVAATVKGLDFLFTL